MTQFFRGSAHLLRSSQGLRALMRPPRGGTVQPTICFPTGIWYLPGRSRVSAPRQDRTTTETQCGSAASPGRVCRRPVLGLLGLKRAKRGRVAYFGAESSVHFGAIGVSRVRDRPYRCLARSKFLQIASSETAFLCVNRQPRRGQVSSFAVFAGILVTDTAPRSSTSIN